MIDRKNAKQQILAAAREMAKAFPSQEYCYAREHFGLLGIIKRITGNIMPTARQCWEYVGLDRSAIVDEFEFAQADFARKAHEVLSEAC
ncbi:MULTISPECIES: hypothetical protein [Ectopseudomonas]|jgi:hypothetical protein|uniref:Uncharacterized protein n=2 Tax=Ectopseudomonas TaxID=3236654 RepID=A0A1G6PX39_9GAMM|nr:MULTISPECIES: hypothetical protein [Pseudomonas]ALN21861.1 hypothetical protein DW68_024600 [Pseudomonas mendocina S5.2]KER98084.1 hypothetical protein HN51_25115 [Pseudomonas mendocina]MBP3061967.1 hypothetical protein [Pseudomonas chengduensis]NNB75260.1 hypothetical protein [Pseudomonas chengduensis]SDC84693.1 hypothetical protein SAMN05216576_107138 [Pseudomonas chengduensis]